MPSDLLLYQLLLVELTNALRHRDGDAAAAVLRRLYDFQPDWTDRLVTFLLQEGHRHRSTGNPSGLSN